MNFAIESLLRGHELLVGKAFSICRRLERSPHGLQTCPIMQKLNELDQSQWCTRDEIEVLQIAKTRALLFHARQTVPYYRRIFKEAGFIPEQFRELSDLQKLPVLTKQDIQDHFPQLRSAAVPDRDCFVNHTGGSTGQPLRFIQTHAYHATGMADIWRNFMMCGYRPGERRVFLWGSDYDARDHKGFKSRVVSDFLMKNFVWVNTFELSEEELERAIRMLKRYRPRLIVAYVSSVTLLANYLRDNGVGDIRPMAIQTSAEVLTPAQRQLLQDTFGCEVFDRYGCREVGNIAHECSEHNGLHLLAENNLTEFLDTEGKPVDHSQTGLVTVTNLNNFAMPLIRYQLGDLGRPKKGLCSCGRGLPLMDVIDGRSTDMIMGPSGRILHGEFFTHLFYELEGVRQFQVVQKTRRQLEIKIVPKPGFDWEAGTGFLRKIIHEHGDEQFDIVFSKQLNISPAKSGKFRFVYSDVKPDSCR